MLYRQQGCCTGTIVKRSRKDGSVAWLAQIVIKRGGRIILRENKTFERRSTASAWLSQQEEHLGEPEALESALQTKSNDNRVPTLADAIDCSLRTKRHADVDERRLTYKSARKS